MEIFMKVVEKVIVEMKKENIYVERMGAKQDNFTEANLRTERNMGKDVIG
jgi:hypothetical protein